MEARYNKLKQDITDKTALVKQLKASGQDERAFKVYKELDALKKEKALLDNFKKIKA